MKIAITREVSRSFARCELTHLEREPIDVELARRQHSSYCAALETLGLEITRLPELPKQPDAVFVEDPAIVLDELAILTRPGAVSRRAEVESLGAALEEHRPLVRIDAPATLEGGDVFRCGRTLFVGRSGRTNACGIDRLREITESLGYEIVPVSLSGCLHLKSACCPLGDETVLANRAWLSKDELKRAGLTVVDVPAEEPRGANVIVVGARALVPAAHPRTAEKLNAEGFETLEVETSELMKAESGLTCSSLIFEAGPVSSPREARARLPHGG